jgi:uncharacterized protein YecE (DUF72 family)
MKMSPADEPIADPDVTSLWSPPAARPEPVPALAVMDPESSDKNELDRCLTQLTSSDELERNEALVDLFRNHQHLLVARIMRAASRNSDIETLLELLWKHADAMLLEDYFFSHRRMKLIHLLGMLDCPTARRFRMLVNLFAIRRGSSSEAVDSLKPFEADGREGIQTVLRALLVHPLPGFRRHALERLEPTQFWFAVSYPQAPLTALADILDRVAQQDVSDDYRKVFFDCTARRVAKSCEPESVRAARQMLNTYFTFDLFMEDDYFRRIIKLNEAVEREEARLKLQNPLFKQALETLEREKARIGPRKTQLPKSFTEIPQAVQRKLARDGYYIPLFIRHPNPKIALETARWVKTPAAAEAVFKTKAANRYLVVELAKQEDLFGTQTARLALLSNPHTPLQISQKYVPLMRVEELRKLAASREVSRELAAYLKNRIPMRPPY